MIEEFGDTLRPLDIDTVQLAEILWVALHRTVEPTSPALLKVLGESSELIVAPPIEPSASTPPPIPERLAPTQPQPQPTPAPPNRPQDEAGSDRMYLVPARPSRGVLVDLPAPAALPDRLRIARSLRTFKRRYPTNRALEFDVDTTVQVYGETGLLVPLQRPAWERWFDVTLVIDVAPTMEVWASATAELTRLLAGHGAFRRVRKMLLTEDADGPRLTSVTGKHVRLRQSGIRDSRHLVMVVSDCVGTNWYRESRWELLREWGRDSPVVLIQTLPQRLWEFTALEPVDARVSGYRPGQANRKLRVTWPWWSSDEGQTAGVIPVVTLAGPELANWARMVMGSADVQVPAALTMGIAADEPSTRSAPSPEERVAMFKAMVSVEAYELAVCLAATPIRLPIARIVQQALVGSRDPAHLAELFVGGLVRRETPVDADVSPDEVVYEFRAGVRDVLQRSLTGTRTLEIFRAVARYLTYTGGISSTFSALLTNMAGDATIDPAFRPFAEVGRPLLERFRLTSAMADLRHHARSSGQPQKTELKSAVRAANAEPPAPGFSRTSLGAFVDGFARLPARERIAARAWLPIREMIQLRDATRLTLHYQDLDALRVLVGALTQARDLGLDLGHALDRVRGRDFASGLELASDLAEALQSARALEDAVSSARVLASRLHRLLNLDVTKGFVEDLARAGARAHSLGFDHNATRAHDRSLVRDRVRNLALDLAVVLAVVLNFASDNKDQKLTRTRLRSSARALINDLAGTLAKAGVLDAGRARDFVVALTRTLEREVLVAGELSQTPNVGLVDALGQLIEATTDAIGADLSHVDLERIPLQGLRWSESTRWPDEWLDQIHRDSVELRPGLYEIRQGGVDVDHHVETPV